METGNKEYPEHLHLVNNALIRMMRYASTWAAMVEVADVTMKVYHHAEDMIEEHSRAECVDGKRIDVHRAPGYINKDWKSWT